MDIGAGKPQMTTLLPNDAISRLERMRINASRRFTDRHSGEHLSLFLTGRTEESY